MRDFSVVRAACRQTISTNINMKKFFTTLSVVLCTLCISNAQTLEQVTELFNNAAQMLDADNKVEAVKLFEDAFNQATALGESGNEVAAQCKDILPKLYLSIGKDKAVDKDYDGAVASVKQAMASAEKFADTDVATEAKELVSQLMLAKANGLLSAKDIAGAIAAYKEIIAAEPENGTAYLRLGQALSAGGKVDEAIANFQKAVEFGEGEDASKQLSTVFLKKAAACQKAKDNKGALENAQKSAEYNDNPTAQKLIGLSALGLKQNKTAADAFEAYLAMSPNAKDKAQIMYQLGTALIAAGDNAKACGYFKQIAQDPKWGEAARYQITVLKCN